MPNKDLSGVTDDVTTIVGTSVVNSVENNNESIGTGDKDDFCLGAYMLTIFGLFVNNEEC